MVFKIENNEIKISLIDWIKLLCIASLGGFFGYLLLLLLAFVLSLFIGYIKFI